MTLNAITGVISGTSTSAVGMPFAFSVTTKDSAGNVSVAQGFTISVSGVLAVANSPLPAGELGVPYQTTLAASGGSGQYSNWSVSAGSLPAGLTLNPGTGTISGTPTNAAGGQFSFNVTVRDSAGVTSAAQAFSIVIAPPVVVNAVSLPVGEVNAAYHATLAASGGISPYNTWTVSAGSLPPGLTLNAGTGAIGGTPSSVAGSPFSFSVAVKDSAGNTSAAQAFSIAVSSGLTVTTTSLPGGAVGSSYSATLAAAGGTQPYVTWALSTGSLPAGLTLNPGSGAITGTPVNVVGSPYSFSVTVKDSSGATSAAQTLSIAVAPQVVVTTSSLSGAEAGVAYSVTLAAENGTPPYGNWTVSAGSLPSGLTLNAGTGVIGGTPASSTGSPFSFSVTLRDAGGVTSAAQPLSIVVLPQVTVSASALASAVTGAPYSATLGATGGSAPYTNWTVSGGTLPAGLTLNAATGVIGGTPVSAAGSPFSFAVTVRDNFGVTSAAQSFSMAVAQGVAVAAETLPAGGVGSSYSAALAATGGIPPYGNWVVSVGSLPPGLTLNAATGIIGGTPSSAAGSPFAFSADGKRQCR